MRSPLNLKPPWRQILLSLALFLSLAASMLIGGAAQQAHAAATPGWTTSGTQILNPTGAPFTITGINWYGFETTGFVAHGLYSQDYRYILGEIRQYGYNTIRIPFSNEMWETDPIPRPNTISACSDCKGKHSRDILALILNYAGSLGLHVILDNHRSEAGNSAEANGLWYNTARHQNYTEQSWISDWQHIQQWVHGSRQTQGATDTVTVTGTASDGLPTVLGYDLRDEPHTPARTAYLQGATWGTGDGIDPAINPNPNPFAPACVSTSTCHDWRLAAERAADTLLGDAATNGWDSPLIFVEGTGQYPVPGGTAANGPYDYYWWGGDLQGVNGNATNPGAPIVLNAGGNATSLGPDADSQLVYSAHDFGPSVFAQGWFNSSTCYTSGCSASSLAGVWNTHWAFINAGGINPFNAQGNQSSYPWGNTGSAPYSQAPMYLGEFGTGNASSDLFSTGAGSEGQWFTDLVNFIGSSYQLTSTNDSGIAVTNLQWTYWALNTEDSFALLGKNYTGLANPTKEYTFLCSIQQGPLSILPGTGAGQCGSTGALPGPA
jgi:endoglucanase